MTKVTRSTNAGLMLVRRRRRRSNIGSALDCCPSLLIGVSHKPLDLSSISQPLKHQVLFNPLPAKLFNLNFHLQFEFSPT